MLFLAEQFAGRVTFGAYCVYRHSCDKGECVRKNERVCIRSHAIAKLYLIQRADTLPQSLLHRLEVVDLGLLKCEVGLKNDDILCSDVDETLKPKAL